MLQLTRTLVMCAGIAVCLVAPAMAGDKKVRVRADWGRVELRLGWPICEPAPQREWMEGYWTERCERVWIEARQTQVWVPAEYRTAYDHCGRPYDVLVRPGYWRTECVPGRYETVTRREWVPGRWVYRQHRY